MPCARHSVAAWWNVASDHDPEIADLLRVPLPSEHIEMHETGPSPSEQQRVAARPVSSSSQDCATTPGVVHASAVNANG